MFEFQFSMKLKKLFRIKLLTLILSFFLRSQKTKQLIAKVNFAVRQSRTCFQVDHTN